MLSLVIDLILINFEILGNSKEKQFWPVFRGALQERLHDGPAQTRRETLQRLEGGRHQSSREQGQTQSLNCRLD